ncbi:hypothetical protein [uncultured Thioclava sp.]|jgi:hypothetical protein|uniref:hypothetical protein n=1 Tax=uncultured Thioclava sp. TaxID=473858 RepID=UPI0025DF5FB0|nr:hypothetical protein [uncultured Thioclava sp.]
MLFSDPPDAPLTTFKIYGERCSGTNFVETLITSNFPKFRRGRRYNWEKHNFVNPPYALDGTLAVVVVRDVFDWLKSLHRSPHQVGYWYRDVDFSGFLRHEWSGVINGALLPNQQNLPVRFQELMYERHPVTGAPIENVVELRNLKLASQLKVRNLYRNWMFVRFEEARANPEAIVDQIAKHFRRRKARMFRPVDKDVSNFSLPGDVEGKGRLRGYAELMPEDRQFVLDRLNMENERLIGYRYALDDAA